MEKTELCDLGGEELCERAASNAGASSGGTNTRSPSITTHFVALRRGLPAAGSVDKHWHAKLPGLALHILGH